MRRWEILVKLERAPHRAVGETIQIFYSHIFQDSSGDANLLDELFHPFLVEGAMKNV